MPLSVLDLVVLGIVLVSALLAAVRGVTREVLAITAWVIAAAAAWYGRPFLLPTVKEHVASDTVALFATMAAIFLGVLIIVSIFTVKISDLVLDSRIGAVDRSLGFLFGAGRGFLICVICWMFLSFTQQGKMPDWASTARTAPLLESSGQTLTAQLPDDTATMLNHYLKSAKGESAGDEPSEPAGEADAPSPTPAPRSTTAQPAPKR